MTTDGPKGNPEDQPTVDLPQPAPQNGTNPSRFAPDDPVAGRYRIVRFIGEGAMGEVYEAQDLELHESVAG